MSEGNLKDELLKQNGRSAVDQEVTKLRGIVAAEQRRVRRLWIWTIGVWAVWLVLIGLSLGLPMMAKQMAQANPAPTTQPAVVHPDSSPGGITVAVKLIVAVIYIAILLGLPLIGVVLGIMLIVNRHTASVNQVRASLAAIDAQLRMLGAPGVKSD